MTPGALVVPTVSTVIYFDVDLLSEKNVWINERSTALVIGLRTRRTALGRMRSEMLLVYMDILGWTSTFPWRVV